MPAERVHVDTNDIIERYHSGESVNAIAIRYGVSRRAIDLRLDRLGIVRRGNADANRLEQSRRTPEQRAAYTAAAHDAVRGVPQTWEHLCRMAIGRQHKPGNVSAAEVIFRDWLIAAGLQPIQQQAIGPYNCDLGIAPVAVEIFGGNWHASGDHAARLPERSRYILNAGWSLLIIWVDGRNFPLTIHAAKHAITMYKASRIDPSTVGQYRVIRGTGEFVTAGRGQIDDASGIRPSRSRKDRRT